MATTLTRTSQQTRRNVSSKHRPLRVQSHRAECRTYKIFMPFHMPASDLPRTRAGQVRGQGCERDTQEVGCSYCWRCCRGWHTPGITCLPTLPMNRYSSEGTKTSGRQLSKALYHYTLGDSSTLRGLKSSIKVSEGSLSHRADNTV